MDTLSCSSFASFLELHLQTLKPQDAFILLRQRTLLYVNMSFEETKGLYFFIVVLLAVCTQQPIAFADPNGTCFDTGRHICSSHANAVGGGTKNITPPWIS